MENNKELFNPCIDCILISKCIPIYKEELKIDARWPVLELSNSCDLLESMYNRYEDMSELHINEIDKWWKEYYESL